ncbi:MAG TPA: PspC domain-containing protein [Gaiellaceae bacterium]|jgi:signal transduction histidine kinase
MPLPRVSAVGDDRVIAGICAGIARSLSVDVTLVRLVFTLLALAGGAGIVLYLALWLYDRSHATWLVVLAAVIAGSLLLHAVGLSDRSVAGVALIAVGLALAWHRGGSFRADAPVSYAGLAVAAAGAVLLLSGGSPNAAVLAPGAVAGALLMVCGPWLWRLALDRDAERAARIRTEERAEVAARVHDSVLQTLALIQRHAEEPRRVAAIARRQERELRGWLYADRPIGDETASLVAAVSAAAADVEELYGVQVELATAGDCPVDESIGAVVLAAREAMTNAAKFAGVDEIDVYVEVADESVAVYVRDRGIGFARASVPAGRLGLAESIEGRLERAGGHARVIGAPGAGTEVELRLPRRTS